jgi:hypothetical protein
MPDRDDGNRRSDPAIADHDAVAAALARLATGTAPQVDSAQRPAAASNQSTPPVAASVVAEASNACSRLSTAAAFVEDDGEQRLSRAVADAKQTADQARDPAVVERGTELLATLERFRVAAESSIERGQGAVGQDPGETG